MASKQLMIKKPQIHYNQTVLIDLNSFLHRFSGFQVPL